MTSSERKTLFITYLCASMKNIGPENTMRQVTYVTKTRKIANDKILRVSKILKKNNRKYLASA